MYWVIGAEYGNIGMAVCDKIIEMGGHNVVSNADVRSPQLLAQTFDAVMEQQNENGHLEGIVFSAGINGLDWLGSTDMNKATNIISTNAIGFLNLMDVVVRKWHLEPPHKEPLSIVAVSSDAGERPLRTSSAYCASKAALNMLVKVAAREMGPHGWRINAVAPGMVNGTGMSLQMDEEIPKIRHWSLEEALAYEHSQEVVPGRVTPQEVAEVIYSTLTGPAHLNGAIIPVNGGR